MADEDSGNRTEKPTPQRLKKARKEGDISKSKELTSTVLVLVWLVMIWLMLPVMRDRIGALVDASIEAMAQPFVIAAPALGQQAVTTGLWLLLPLLFGSVFLGLLIEFLQAGPVLAPKKAKPDLKHINPMSGLKKVFSKDNLVEGREGIDQDRRADRHLRRRAVRLRSAARRVAARPARSGRRAAVGERHTHRRVGHFRVLLHLGARCVLSAFLVHEKDAHEHPRYPAGDKENEGDRTSRDGGASCITNGRSRTCCLRYGVRAWS